MTPLLKKEIRLILPAWLAVLLLEVWQPWLGHDHDTSLTFAPVLFFFGVILLAVDSFGREFSLGTFSSLMSQPMERRQIWRTKIVVLLVAAGLVFSAYFASCEVRLHRALVDGQSAWQANPGLLRGDFGNAMLASLAVLFIALTGGLWTALLLRQISAAFWITMLAPAGLAMLVIFAMSLLFKSSSDLMVYSVLYGAGGLYVLSTFWLAHRLFLRAEDAGWTGGVISFSKWRYFENTRHPKVSLRQSRPLTALLKKELQLHSISLFGAGALLVLHLGVFFLRAFYVPHHEYSLADVASENFWVLWLVLPLVIGCAVVAEERKLGVMEGQFCLPVSRRLQFGLKLSITLVLGILLGGVMPLLLETAVMRLGVPGEFFKHNEVNLLLILALASGLALLGFVASTLARNFLQALSIAIIVTVGAFLGFAFLQSLAAQFQIYEQRLLLLGLIPDSWGLIALFSLPVLVVVLPWLVFRNFNYFQDGVRLWRRNLMVVLGSIILVLGSSAGIYQRPWELLQPAEPPHGLAALSPTNPPQLQTEVPYGLQVRLPDGRVWCDSLGYSFWDEIPTLPNVLWTLLAHPLPRSGGPRAFVAGSNWVATTAWSVHFWAPAPNTNHLKIEGYLDTIGIQTNGTLWISREAEAKEWTGSQMMQFGSDTDWRQVVRLQATTALLLKADGTLWQWGTNQIDWSHWQIHWPSLRNLPLTRVGTNADWQAIFTTANIDYARKLDGTVWSASVPGKEGQVQLTHQAELDQVLAPMVAKNFDGHMACVHPDGTLWLDWRAHSDKGVGSPGPGLDQLGQDTHWQAVTVTYNRVVALKTDGSLWQWDLSTIKSREDALNRAPTKLGIHQDWVALANNWVGAVALSADGSLWLWPDRRMEAATWLRLPRQPQLIGNVFAANFIL